VASSSKRFVYIAGHSNLAVTQRYMHATANDLKEAMSKLKK